MARVKGPVRLVLTVEFDAIAEPVEGLVRSAGRPDQAFSGWSELFAVLIALTSEAGGDEVASDPPRAANRAGGTPRQIREAEENPHANQAED
jgi:hypothetical protein